MGSLTTVLSQYLEQGKWRELINLYKQTRTQGFQPNSFTFTSLLKFCISLPFPLHQGKSLHAQTIKSGFVESDGYVLNSLITMYAQCDLLFNARRVFDGISVPNLVNWNTIISSFFRAGECDGAREIFDRMKGIQYPNDITWSAMISGYTQNYQAKEALCAFKQMRGECNELGIGLSPNGYTIASVFSACGQLRDLVIGEQVHGYTVKISAYIENDVFVGCALLDVYGRCYRQELAKLVFDSMVEKCVVAWSTLIATYVRNSCPSYAIEAFRDMVSKGEEPNYVTLSTLITACGELSNLVLGKELHGFIMRKGDMKQDVIVSTSLIDMYGKCHYMIYAQRILEKSTLECSPTPMWNATISGYVENNCYKEAWEVFRSMNQAGGSSPNSVTMAIALPLCTRLSMLLHGKEVHCYALKSGLDDELLVGNSLLDMYTKCGKLHLAENHFKKMIKRNTVSWTAMIDGYGMHGDGEGAIKIFECLVRDNDVKPDHVTFVALISSCSHAGRVEEGLKYFQTMSEDYGIVPTEEIYGSVVDLLARAGRLNEAKSFIANMPIEPGANVWGAFLGACKIHGNVTDAEHAAEKLLGLEPKEGGFRKLLSSVYSDIGSLDRVAEGTDYQCFGQGTKTFAVRLTMFLFRCNKPYSGPIYTPRPAELLTNSRLPLGSD
ncbi:hypothetical protein IFM89_007441 [Coptis chinensis]|uniref:Pentatricopeptide repeat-containing protein n=1 Tax=Coptis chinensis TaxID=261450 RepID=A0A835ICL1_9MAGN|nr:hypothetical protein IFM89_007441 [Coptis chinensis]